MNQIGVLGAGTWGIALARMLSNSGNTVQVWSAISSEIDMLSETRMHRNLPNVVIPREVGFTKDIREVCTGKEILVLAVPSIFVRPTVQKAAPYILGDQIIVDVAKGIEPETLKTMTEVIESELRCDANVVALSGPTHAEEVAQDLPTTIVAAHVCVAVAEKVQAVFTNPVMRVYTNTDIKGVELCGALKNIIALAAGIASGLGYGDNTKAALITRGLAEIKRLGIQMGCLPETFSGLAGMGDLIVTATSMHSRNNRCGYLIGQGYQPDEATKQVGMVVEGINAVAAAVTLAKKYDVEMPIVAAVDQIINYGVNPLDAVHELMERDRKTEL